MPIIIKDYDWRQTEELVLITIPLKGICLQKTDIFSTDNYLKIHSPPFLFEVCLWRSVVEDASECTLANGEAEFRLVKQTPEHWPSLAAELTRQEALEVKTKAIEEAHARAEKLRKETSEKKSERQKSAVREQIRLQTQELELIKNTKEKEKTEALIQLGWNKAKTSVKITELTDEEDENLTREKKKDSAKKVDKEIFKLSSKLCVDNCAPKPREAGQISVMFTPRVFPTPCRESKIAEEQEVSNRKAQRSPCRESKIAEEQEWLSKQAEARRRTGFVAEDLRPEERDPFWLYDKAQLMQLYIT